MCSCSLYGYHIAICVVAPEREREGVRGPRHRINDEDERRHLSLFAVRLPLPLMGGGCCIRRWLWPSLGVGGLALILHLKKRGGVRGPCSPNKQQWRTATDVAIRRLLAASVDGGSPSCPSCHFRRWWMAVVSIVGHGCPSRLEVGPHPPLLSSGPRVASSATWHLDTLCEQAV
jgi:hypothetical protein